MYLIWMSDKYIWIECSIHVSEFDGCIYFRVFLFLKLKVGAKDAVRHTYKQKYEYIDTSGPPFVKYTRT